MSRRNSELPVKLIRLPSKSSQWIPQPTPWLQAQKQQLLQTRVVHLQRTLRLEGTIQVKLKWSLGPGVLNYQISRTHMAEIHPGLRGLAPWQDVGHSSECAELSHLKLFFKGVIRVVGSQHLGNTVGLGKGKQDSAFYSVGSFKRECGCWGLSLTGPDGT